jgi:hypothetical protein
MVGGVTIEERFEPLGSGATPGFKRTMTLTGAKVGVSIWINAGAGAKMVGEVAGARVNTASDGTFELVPSKDATVRVQWEVRP